MTSIAETVIAKFGGAPAVARILGMERTGVYKWTYPKDRGGLGGKVPSKRQGELLVKAKELGVELSPDDFFDLPTPSRANGQGQDGVAKE